MCLTIHPRLHMSDYTSGGLPIWDFHIRYADLPTRAVNPERCLRLRIDSVGL